MVSRTVVVGSRVGLHARPASLVARAADAYPDEILIHRVGTDPADAVDASSSLMILTLEADQGDAVVVTSDNADAVDTLADLIERELDPV